MSLMRVSKSLQSRKWRTYNAGLRRGRGYLSLIFVCDTSQSC